MEPPLSRTRQKKHVTRLQKLGERLIELPTRRLRVLGVDAELAAAVETAKALRGNHGAYRRQLQTIGALMRGIDPEPVRRALAAMDDGDDRRARVSTQAENWRDRLLAGDEGVVEVILQTCPEADRQRLAQLARNARRHSPVAADTRPARRLLHYLRDICRNG